MKVAEILLTVLGLLGSALTQANVTGVVKDASGGIVAHAFVEAVPRSSTADRGTVGDVMNPWIPADEMGNFSVTLRPGRYVIRAKDEADGYADPVYLLNADPTAVFPEITVAQGNVSRVTVLLGRKGGMLEGRLLDRESHTGIVHGKITIRDLRNPDAYVEVFSKAGGIFRFVVASKPVTVSASAAGYKPAPYDSGAELTLSGNERRDITLTLEHD
jgi:hypothetical protein